MLAASAVGRLAGHGAERFDEAGEHRAGFVNQASSPMLR
jgi:hypothetical protein